MLDRQRLDRPR